MDIQQLNSLLANQIPILVAHGLKPSSAAPYKSAVNAFIGFIRSSAVQDATLSPTTIEAFDAHLRAKFNGSSTVGTYHSYLKSIINSACLCGLLTSNPYQHVKVRRSWHTSQRRALSASELSRLEHIDRSRLSCHQTVVLDRFLFSCYTGLRISDSLRITKSALVFNHDGLYLDFVSHKGRGSRITLPLDLLAAGKASQIARLYSADGRSGNLFPPQSVPTIRKHLTSLARLAGLSCLTFHMSRHTCATSLALSTGSPYLIKAVLGHSSINTSMHYIHTSGSWLESELRKCLQPNR